MVQDGVVPILDLSATVRYRSGTGNAGCVVPAWVHDAVGVAGWDGQVLPQAEVLGVLVYPVVDLTHAQQRADAGQWPERSLTTLEMWETWSEELPLVPPRPLRIIGFLAATQRWQRAVRNLRAVSGLGSGMIASRRPVTDFQLLEADACEVWVVAPLGPEAASLHLAGRVGPVRSAVRVPATRLMEEGLFAHALACGAVS
jgi:hypothetical protein